MTDNIGSSTAQATRDNYPMAGNIDDPVLIALPVVTPPDPPVVAVATPVPTLSQWALIGLSVLLAMLGFGGMRRRQ